MTDELELLGKRFIELSRKADNGYYTYSDFLGLQEQATLATVKAKLYTKYTPFGGAVGTERIIVRFGDPETIGYEEDFPIVTLRVSPKSERFADRLTHRDFLGTILGLGIERATVGDIVIRENVGYVFLSDKIAEYVKDSLTRIKHTDVKCEIISEIPGGDLYKTEIKRIQANGERLDAIVAKVFCMSRDDASLLFKKRLVFADGREIESVSYNPKEGQVISVRGYGRFISRGYDSLTKKGKKNIDVEVYV